MTRADGGCDWIATTRVRPMIAPYTTRATCREPRWASTAARTTGRSSSGATAASPEPGGSGRRPRGTRLRGPETDRAPARSEGGPRNDAGSNVTGCPRDEAAAVAATLAPYAWREFTDRMLARRAVAAVDRHAVLSFLARIPGVEAGDDPPVEVAEADDERVDALVL